MDNRLDELRIYVDTCVFGGVCDEEFTEPTQAFFEQVRLGRFRLVVSALVEDELAEAPRSIQDCYDDMLPYCEVIYPTADSIRFKTLT
ncbi:MAG: hypothetical protein ABFD54_01860 [Armatimonadota bacterium]|nr:hypothetical protein [bacterium]